MKTGRRVQVAVFLIIAIALAVYGQLTWTKKPDEMADPFVLFALAGIFAALAVRAATHAVRVKRAEFAPVFAPVESRPQIPVSAWRIALISVGVVANLVALALIRDGLEDYTFQVALWIVSWILFAAGWLDAGAVRKAVADLPELWRRNRTDILVVAGFTAVALALRLVRLDSVPYVISGDEGSIGLDMRAALTGQMRDPFIMGWGPQPSMFYFFHALMARLFGDNVFVLRLPSALLGALVVPAVYLLGRELAGRKVGLVAAALAIGYHFLLHYSRIGINSTWGSATIPLAAWLFLRGIRRHSSWALAGCALILGLQFHLLYPGSARFAPILLMVVLAWMLLSHRRSLSRAWGIIGMTALFTFLIASPALQFGLRHPDEFNARFNQVGIIQSGWLRNEVVVRQQSATAIVLDQLKLSVLGLFSLPDKSASYGAASPLLGPIMAVFFVLGLGYAMVRMLRTEYFVPVVWFLGALIGGGVLTVNPPTSNRVVDLIVPLLILSAVGLVTILELAQRTLRLHPTIVTLVAGLMVAAVLVRDTTYYFIDYQKEAVYGGLDAQVATSAGYFMRAQPAGTQLFFLGPPRMWVGFSTLPYLAPQMVGVDIVDPLATGDLPLTPGAKGVVIALPGRTAELDLVRARYPGGTVVDSRRLGMDELLYTMYELPAAAGGR